MKKRIFALLFALAIIASAFTVAHAETDLYVLASDSFIDDGYLTQDELVDHNVTGIEIENTYGYAATIAIIDSDLYGAYTSAEDVYNLMTDSPNGILLIHDIVYEEYDYYLAGDGEEVFSQYIDTIINAYHYTSTYNEGVEAYYLAVEDALTAFNSTPVTDGGYIDTDDYEDDYDEGYVEDSDIQEDEEADGDFIPCVIDDAGLLSENEYKNLHEELCDLSEEYETDFIVATVDAQSLDGMQMDANSYADFIYQYGLGGVRKEGTVIYLYIHGGEGEREIVIVRYGDAKDEFSDSDCEGIINATKEEIVDGNYADAFSLFAERAEKVLNPSVHWIWIPLCLVIGFVIAFIIMKIIASANKSVRNKVNAAEYVRPNSLVITNSAEIFLYNEVKSSPKASSTSSSDTKGGGRSTSSGKF